MNSLNCTDITSGRLASILLRLQGHNGQKMQAEIPSLHALALLPVYMAGKDRRSWRTRLLIGVLSSVIAKTIPLHLPPPTVFLRQSIFTISKSRVAGFG